MNQECEHPQNSPRRRYRRRSLEEGRFTNGNNKLWDDDAPKEVFDSFVVWVFFDVVVKCVCCNHNDDEPQVRDKHSRTLRDKSTQFAFIGGRSQS